MDFLKEWEEKLHIKITCSQVKLELINLVQHILKLSMQKQQGFQCFAGNRANGDCRAPAACK